MFCNQLKHLSKQKEKPTLYFKLFKNFLYFLKKKQHSKQIKTDRLIIILKKTVQL